MASDPEYVEPEIPAEYKLKRAIAGLSEDLVETYEAWRVLCVDGSTGKVSSVCKTNGNEDYKTERNAKKQAAIYNKYWARGNPLLVYVVRKCKITVEPIKTK